MKKFTIFASALLIAGAFATVEADTLFYFGHGGINEGHTQLADLYARNGCGGQFIEDNGAVLPTLDDYNLVFISVPGFLDPSAFFSAAEKAALTSWLTDGDHRLVLIGEWDGFYGEGAAVMIDLINDIGVGGMDFLPGFFDAGCDQCNGTVTSDPLTDGLDHVCKAATSTWDEGGGASVAFPNENPDDPFIISNGSDVPCIVAIGDSNVLSDGCFHIMTDSDTEEFALRLCLLNCAGEVPVEEASWGRIKATYN
jgi:hypothetical protein